MKGIFHPEQFFSLAFKHSFDRNARPLCHNLRNILWSNSFCDDRVLNCSLPILKIFNLSLCFRHLSITDLRHLAIVSGPFGIMCFNLVILHLLSCRLELRKDLLLFIPSLPQLIPLTGQFLQLGLYLVRLERHPLSLHSLLLDFQLADTAVKLGNRLWNGIHLQTKL